MSEKIEPALSAGELRECLDIIKSGNDPLMYGFMRDSDKAISLINYLRADSDPKKITREKVTFLREMVTWMWSEFGFNDGDAGPLEAITDALESYLPPL